jgi:hypothetical protein
MASLSSLDMLGLFFLTKTPPPLPLLFSFSGGFFFIPPLFPTSKGEVSSSSSDPDSSSASDFFLCIALSFFGFLEVAFPSSSAPSILGSLGCLGFFLLGRRLGRASTSSSTCVLAAIVSRIAFAFGNACSCTIAASFFSSSILDRFSFLNNPSHCFKVWQHTSQLLSSSPSVWLM